MAEVVAIRQGLAVEPPAGTVNQDVVAELEKLLEAAQSGEVIGVAISMTHPGGLTSWRLAGRRTRALIGVMEMMKYDMCRTDFEDKE